MNQNEFYPVRSFTLIGRNNPPNIFFCVTQYVPVKTGTFLTSGISQFEEAFKTFTNKGCFKATSRRRQWRLRSET